MDITVSGKLTITADKKVLASIANAFGLTTKNFDKDDIIKVDESFEKYMGEAYSFNIKISEKNIIIPIKDSYNLVSEWDSFVEKILKTFSGIKELLFEGTEDSWSSGEFSRFLAKYDGSDLYIADSGYYQLVYSGGECEEYEELFEVTSLDEKDVSFEFFEEHKDEDWYKPFKGKIVSEIPLPDLKE